MKKAPFAVPDNSGKLKLEHVKEAYVILNEFHHGQVTSINQGGIEVTYDSVLQIRNESKQLQV